MGRRGIGMLGPLHQEQIEGASTSRTIESADAPALSTLAMLVNTLASPVTGDALILKISALALQFVAE